MQRLTSLTGASPDARLSTLPCAGFSPQPTPDLLALDNQPQDPRGRGQSITSSLVPAPDGRHSLRCSRDVTLSPTASRRWLMNSEEQISSKTTQWLQLAAVGPGHFIWGVSEGYRAQTLQQYITVSISSVVRVYPRETNRITGNNPVFLGGLPFKSKLQN